MKSSDTQMELVRRYLGGEATLEEARKLESMLAVDAQLRRDYVAYARVEAGLSSKVRPKLVKTAPPKRWLSWRPLTAAAAGIVFGMFCTSLVFAYIAPSLGKVVTLLDDSFESGATPLVTGVPIEAGRWSGDYSEVVGEQQGVKPESGEKMLRLLRDAYEGKTNTQRSRVADIYRLVDMRPYRREFADGSAIAQLSAAFNTFESPEAEIYSCRMSIHAFTAEVISDGTVSRPGTWDEHCLASASTGGARLDRNAATWQKRTSDLRLPANTDFLMIHLIISAVRGTVQKPGFDGHYIDDVRLTLHDMPLR